MHKKTYFPTFSGVFFHILIRSGIRDDKQGTDSGKKTHYKSRRKIACAAFYVISSSKKRY